MFLLAGIRKIIGSVPLHIWLLLFILIGALIGIIYYKNSYETELVRSTDLIGKIKSYEAAEKVRIESDRISDKIQAELITKKKEIQKEQAQSRTEVIDEYISLSGRGYTPPVWPEVKAKTTNGESTTTEIEHETDTKKDSINKSINAIAKRMYEHYCAASRENTSCNPK